MKPPSDPLASGLAPQADTPSSGGRLHCSDIQVLLSAYMMRELGDVQSRVVREHLRSCEHCRREAADLQDMLETLQAGAADARGAMEGAGGRLTDERRARIMWVVFHPVLDWIYCHHRLVSTVAAVLVLAAALFVFRHAAIFRVQPLDEGIPVWRMFRSGRLPALVDRAMEQQAARFDGQSPPDSKRVDDSE